MSKGCASKWMALTMNGCALQVIVLKGISVPGIKTLLRNTIWQGDRIHRGEPLCVRLGLQPDTKEWDLFSNDVHSLTGGVPALVVPALTSCVTHRPQGGWGRLAHDKLREMLSPKVDWLTPWEAVVAASPQQVPSCQLPLPMLQPCYCLLRCLW